jgi:hypothetical protein
MKISFILLVKPHQADLLCWNRGGAIGDERDGELLEVANAAL